MNAFNFLIDTLFDLYIMVILLRVWLQLARADFYNPFSQFVVKATQPVVGPLRRFIPAIGSLDTATVVFAIAVAALKVIVLTLMLNAGIDLLVIGISSVIIVITSAFKMLTWVLIIRAILSWVSQGHNPIEAVMIQLTEPLLRPIRNRLPSMGGLDLSMVVVILGIQFLEILFRDFISKFLG
ncbi:YggT family protein [Psychromonas algicola]|uniref:YggT family protein n=1 Tax=Psychromonas algicola TaxID=2555642 RepID=UPI001068AE45|nr:YggT family protein [Psychromonas sp. RZ5]TEW51274.1 YggT family protein [Psychromonas sp. RZ5]